MRTIIAHLQKYYGVYLLIIAVVFLILWLPNRAANRYAICCQNDNTKLTYILDTRTGQTWLSLLWLGNHIVHDLGTPDKPINQIITGLSPEGHRPQGLYDPNIREMQELYNLLKAHDSYDPNMREIHKVYNWLEAAGFPDPNIRVIHLMYDFLKADGQIK